MALARLLLLLVTPTLPASAVVGITHISVETFPGSGSPAWSSMTVHKEYGEDGAGGASEELTFLASTTLSVIGGGGSALIVDAFNRSTEVFGYPERDSHRSHVIEVFSSAFEGIKLWGVESGDRLTATGILGGAFVKLETFPPSSPYYYLPPDGPFYLGVSLPYDLTDSTGPDLTASPPAFGWIHLEIGEDGFVNLLDHAMAYDVDGIVVGTTEQVIVPEPTTVSLCGLGLFLLFVRRRCGLSLS